MDYEILLYYKYVPIDNPEELVKAHKEFMAPLGMTGRIIISHEGINGTCEGTKEASEKYQTWLTADSRFADMWFKKSPGTGDAFPKLSIKARKEIVSAYLGEEDFNPADFTAPHLPAEKLHEWLQSDDKPVIIDMRNQYEFKVGHFEDSVLPPLENFRDLPKVLPDLEKYKDKKVVTVCTGGVRCEKAAGYLLKKGFTNVHQLEGGMVTYMEKFPKGAFKGKLYVFDKRVAVAVPGGEDNEIIGRCIKCDSASERYINCGNLACHDHVIVCEACAEESDTCSQKCAEVVNFSLA
jgi:UPF0176 protein